MTLFDKYNIDIFQVLRPFIYIICAMITYEIIKRIMKKSMDKSLLKKRHHQKRVNTVNSLILNIIRYCIIIAVGIMILSNFGVNVKSILAGLGITAFVIGLAFQDIAKDLIAGISIIMEDQYEIGDIIEVNGFKGEVVSLGLKTTRIKNFNGSTKIIANHLINEVINYNLYPLAAIIDVSVGYDYTPEEVEEVLENMSKNLSGKIPKTTGKIEVLGINDLEASGVVYRIVQRLNQNDASSKEKVERTLRKEVKKALDDASIKIPYTQIEVHNGK